MGYINLIETFSEFKEFKNIDRETMMVILEEVFRHMLEKRFGSDENFDVIVNIDKGDLQIWRNREIVENGMVEDDNTEIEYSEAIKIEPDFEIGEEVSEEMKLEDFGRREILAIRQNLTSKIQEFEKNNIFKKYKEKIGDIITADVYQIWKREILVRDDEEIELILPKQNQIPSDYFRKGDTVRAVVLRVDLRNNNPVIILSRTAPEFLERLFEHEVPEVYDGLITVKNIVRIPGERAKISVESYDDRIDPVGACVGMKGSRIHGIVRELRNESIDVINYTSNTKLYIQRSLSPANISNIVLDEENNKAEVYLKPDQVSLAIGRGGNNIKLAGRLTGYEIDVYREEDIDAEDVSLAEFSDEMDKWVIETFQKIGCDTAKSILKLSEKELVDRTDLEVETIREVVRILKAEFE
ncbi:MAG: transcription termination factor NusA [Bacteroidota bacterium]|nr:transcription termination factor NusA [Bacteroidota bacterium]